MSARGGFEVCDRVVLDGTRVVTVVPTSPQVPCGEINVMDPTGSVQTVRVDRLVLLSAMPVSVEKEREFWWGNTPYPFESTYVPDPVFVPRFAEFEVSREGGCPVHMVHAPCGWESEVDKMPEKYATITELIALAESHLRYGCNPTSDDESPAALLTETFNQIIGRGPR